MLIKLNFIYLVPNDQNVSEVILLQFFRILNASNVKAESAYKDNFKFLAFPKHEHTKFNLGIQNNANID